MWEKGKDECHHSFWWAHNSHPKKSFWVRKAETITKCTEQANIQRARKKHWEDFLYFSFHINSSKKEKYFPCMNIDSGKKGENFLYHQMNGAEYKWKVWRRNQICKFEMLSQKVSHRTPRIHFIAARMWLPFSYLKSSSLEHEIWGNKRKLEKWRGKVFLMSNISWKLFYF